MANDMGEDEVDEVFRSVCMALMSDDGRLKRVHDSTVSLEVCPRQYEAEIRVVKGACGSVICHALWSYKIVGALGSGEMRNAEYVG